MINDSFHYVLLFVLVVCFLSWESLKVALIAIVLLFSGKFDQHGTFYRNCGNLVLCISFSRNFHNVLSSYVLSICHPIHL